MFCFKVLSPSLGFPVGAVGKEPSFEAVDKGVSDVIPGSRRSPWRRKWQPTPVFLPKTEKPGRLQCTWWKELEPCRHKPSHPLLQPPLLQLSKWVQYGTHPILPLPAISSPELVLSALKLPRPNGTDLRKPFPEAMAAVFDHPHSLYPDLLCIVYTSHSSRADLIYLV